MFSYPRKATVGINRLSCTGARNYVRYMALHGRLTYVYPSAMHHSARSLSSSGVGKKNRSRKERKAAVRQESSRQSNEMRGKEEEE